jgi:hypothetical protein
MSRIFPGVVELLMQRFGDGRSPSGKAPDFGSGIEGSNPSRPASFSFLDRQKRLQ